MTKRRSLGVASAFLLSLPLIFSNPAYAQTQIDKNSKKNIEYLFKEEHKDDAKNKSKGFIAFREFYFVPRAKGLSNAIYSEIAYEKPMGQNSDRLSFQVAAGYMGLKGRDVNDTRKEKLDMGEINAGLKYKIFGPLYAKGGLSCLIYHLKFVSIPPAFGSYVGAEISPNRDKNPNFFLEMRQHFGDLNINYPLLEDETNVIGQLYGGGIRFKF